MGNLNVTPESITVPMTLGVQFSTVEGDPYTGPYEADPLFTAQTLATRNKVMTGDVTINAIYVAETSNPQGGNTVYIGGEYING